MFPLDDLSVLFSEAADTDLADFEDEGIVVADDESLISLHIFLLLKS
jgi:hypothetical protein